MKNITVIGVGKLGLCFALQLEKAGYNVIGNIVLIDLKFVPRVDNYNIDVKSVVNYE